MVQHYSTRFNASFAALADATRRGVSTGSHAATHPSTDLADKFKMTSRA
jgi:hypothetical protein